MEAISKEKAKEITAEIHAAVAEILEKHKLQVTKEVSGYGDEYGFNLKAIAIKLNEDGINLLSPDVTAYNRFGYGTAVGTEWVNLVAKIGTRFTASGKTFAFAGVGSRGKKKIIGIEVISKKSFIFDDLIIATINKASTEN